jgi:hypothetical protein
LDKHSSFTDLTQRSAWAFRFGLRAGSTSGSTRPDTIKAGRLLAEKLAAYANRPDVSPIKARQSNCSG